MLEGRYTDDQLNACFKKTKEKLEKEKRFMMRLAEAGKNILFCSLLLCVLLERRKEKREIVEKVNLTWRKGKF